MRDAPRVNDNIEILLKVAGARNYLKLDLSRFKLDAVLKLLYASSRFERLFILCNHDTLHKVRALTRDLNSNVELDIITSNDLEDDEIIIAW